MVLCIYLLYSYIYLCITYFLRSFRQLFHTDYYNFTRCHSLAGHLQIQTLVVVEAFVLSIYYVHQLLNSSQSLSMHIIITYCLYAETDIYLISK